MRPRHLVLLGQMAAFVLFVGAGAAVLSGVGNGLTTGESAENRDRSLPMPETDGPVPWSTRHRSEPPRNSLEWQRETQYILWDNRLRIPPNLIPDVEQHGRPEHPNPNRIRILAVGDSYTWGQGAYDLDITWPKQLEDQLNARTRPGTFEVETASKPGTGPAFWLDWFQGGSLKAEDYDLIIMGIVWNDAIVTGHERSFCSEEEEKAGECPEYFLEPTDAYEECMTGRDGPIGTLTRLISLVSPETANRIRDRRCDTESIQQRTGLVSMRDAAIAPQTTPYWEKYREAVAELADEFGETDAFAFHAATNPYEMYASMFVREVMEDAGIRFIDPEASYDLIEYGGKPGMAPSAGSGHPGPAFMHLYAVDAAEETLRTMPADRIAAAEASARAPQRDLISNSMPASVQVENSLTSATITHREGSEGYRHNLSGQTLPEQRTPCASMGRPHLHLMLRRDLPAGTPITISNLSEEDLNIHIIGYDRDRAPIRREAGMLSRQQQTDLIMGGNEAAGVIVTVEGIEGCPSKEPIDLPDLKILITEQQ